MSFPSIKDAGTEASFPEAFTFLVNAEDFKANIEVLYMYTKLFACISFEISEIIMKPNVVVA